jgi:hypothetical protein
MLILALAYSVVLLGPYGTLKDWANISEVRNWSGFAIYATSLWLFALVILPSVKHVGVESATVADVRNRLFFEQMQAEKPDFFLGRVLFAFV